MLIPCLEGKFFTPEEILQPSHRSAGTWHLGQKDPGETSPPVGRHKHNLSWEIWMRDLGSTHPAWAMWRKQIPPTGSCCSMLGESGACWARSHLAPSRRVCIEQFWPGSSLLDCCPKDVADVVREAAFLRKTGVTASLAVE